MLMMAGSEAALYSNEMSQIELSLCKHGPV